MTMKDSVFLHWLQSKLLNLYPDGRERVVERLRLIGDSLEPARDTPPAGPTGRRSMPGSDAAFLHDIARRLVEKAGVHPSEDYVLKLRAVADSLPADRYTQPLRAA